jgi:hypothetical protein
MIDVIWGTTAVSVESVAAVEVFNRNLQVTQRTKYRKPNTEPKVPRTEPKVPKPKFSVPYSVLNSQEPRFTEFTEFTEMCWLWVLLC